MLERLESSAVSQVRQVKWDEFINVPGRVIREYIYRDDLMRPGVRTVCRKYYWDVGGPMKESRNQQKEEFFNGLREV
jgi:hypothetical protein